MKKIDKLFSKKQQEFFYSKDKRLNFLVGSVRSGKTHISILKYALRVVMPSPKIAEFLFCAKTLTTLKRNVLNPLVKLIGESNFSFNITKKEGNLFGHRIYLEGANDETSENKIRGMTLSGAYCDEITLFPESFVTMLLSRLSMPNAKMYATCNPDTPSHYIKEDYIDNEDLDIKTWLFLLKDNIFLDKEYVENIQKEYSGVYYDRYILGKWVRAEGIIYRKYADNTKEYDIEFNEIQKDLIAVNVGVDFGGTGSATTFVCTGFTKGFSKVVPILSERHEEELNPEDLNEAFASFIEMCYSMLGKPMRVYCDSAEQVLIRGLKITAIRRGLRVEIHNARKMAITERIKLVNKLIGQGRFRVYKGAKSVKSALCEALWDAKHEDTRLDDGTTDIDTLDALEYSIEPYFMELSRL